MVNIGKYGLENFEKEFGEVDVGKDSTTEEKKIEKKRVFLAKDNADEDNIL